MTAIKILASYSVISGALGMAVAFAAMVLDLDHRFWGKVISVLVGPPIVILFGGFAVAMTMLFWGY